MLRSVDSTLSLLDSNIISHVSNRMISFFFYYYLLALLMTLIIIDNENDNDAKYIFKKIK